VVLPRSSLLLLRSPLLLPQLLLVAVPPLSMVAVLPLTMVALTPIIMVTVWPLSLVLLQWALVLPDLSLAGGVAGFVISGAVVLPWLTLLVLWCYQICHW